MNFNDFTQLSIGSKVVIRSGGLDCGTLCVVISKNYRNGRVGLKRCDWEKFTPPKNHTSKCNLSDDLMIKQLSYHYLERR